MRIVEGDLKAAENSNYAVVSARWNAKFGDRLVESAIATLKENGANDSQITLVRVPGSYEIPFTAKLLAETKKYDAIIALGTLIEGDTDHYRLISDEVSAGLNKVMFETGVPVSFGVLTCKNIQQAEARVDKGREAAQAALEMVNLISKINEKVNNKKVVGF